MKLQVYFDQALLDTFPKEKPRIKRPRGRWVRPTHVPIDGRGHSLPTEWAAFNWNALRSSLRRRTLIGV